jgi:hypothetical protein
MPLVGFEPSIPAGERPFNLNTLSKSLSVKLLWADRDLVHSVERFGSNLGQIDMRVLRVNITAFVCRDSRKQIITLVRTFGVSVQFRFIYHCIASELVKEVLYSAGFFRPILNRNKQFCVFCWRCISIYALTETNLMHYLSSVYSVTYTCFGLASCLSSVCNDVCMQQMVRFVRFSWLSIPTRPADSQLRSTTHTNFCIYMYIYIYKFIGCACSITTTA